MSAPPTATTPKAPTGYIAGPLYDGIWFIGMPLIALAAGWLVSLSSADQTVVSLFGTQSTVHALALRTIIHAHLVIVFFRSHGNREVFARHRLRFTLVPVLLFAAALASDWLLIGLVVVTTFWDVYHSSMQTFGLGRIYEARDGGAPAEGRAQDIWLNHVIYIAPLLVGPLLPLLVHMFDKYHHIGVHSFDFIPRFIDERHADLARVVVVASIGYALYYALWTFQRARRGRPISWKKMALFATTALASWLAWGFNSFGEALLIVNLFHAVQYFAIVWWAEKKSMLRLFDVERFAYGAALAGGAFVLMALSYGFLVGATSSHWSAEHLGVARVMICVSNLVALLHFWYDGFIWSVRRREV